MEYIKEFLRKPDISYARYKTNSFCNFISPSDTVLDLGSGRGYLAQSVSEITGADVTCVDISDQNETSLPHIMYDGENLPFNDNTFDVVLLIFVLHHAEEQLKLLDEVKRVTKNNGRIIILEDSYINKLQYVFTMIADYVLNAPKGIATPFNFRKESEWKKIFGKLGLEVLTSKPVDLGMLDLVRHPLFVLRNSVTQ